MGLKEPVILSDNSSAFGDRNHKFMSIKESAREEEVKQMIEKLKRINLNELE